MEHPRSRSSRESRKHANLSVSTSSYQNFLSAAPSARSASSSSVLSARFASDRSQIGSPTQSAVAPPLSRLYIPSTTPHGHTNLLHLACINGDKQSVIRLISGTASDSSPYLSKSEKGSHSARASMNSLNVQSAVSGMA